MIICFEKNIFYIDFGDTGINTTRPDTRLPQSRAGGQGPYLRSPEHLGRSSLAKKTKNAEKVKCDGRIDGPTDRQSGV